MESAVSYRTALRYSMYLCILYKYISVRTVKKDSEPVESNCFLRRKCVLSAVQNKRGS